MSTFDIALPTKRQLLGGLLILLGLGILCGLGIGWLVLHRPAPTGPLLERAQLEHQRQADSAAAFTAGRLYQQRLDAQTLRQKDEAHDKSRPAAGPIELPDLFPTR